MADFIKNHFGFLVPKNGLLLSGKKRGNPYSPTVLFRENPGYKHIYGKTIPVNQILNQLSRFEQESVVTMLAAANQLLSLTEDGRFGSALQDELSEVLLSLSFRAGAQEYVKKKQRKRPDARILWFSRRQLLTMIQWAMLVCVEGKGEPTDPDHPENQFAIGELCIMLTDHLLFQEYPLRKEVNSDAKAKIIALEFVATSELDNDPNWGVEFARTDVILTDCWDSKKFPAKDLYREYSGMSVEEFWAFTIGVWSTFGLPNEDGHIPFNLDVNTFLSNTTPDPVKHKLFQTYQAHIASSFSAHTKDVHKTGRSTPTGAFLSLRRKPIIKNGKMLQPIDIGFLLDRASRDLFWELHDQYKESERELFHSGWGLAFEKYVHSLFFAMFPESTKRYFPSPLNKQNEEFADAFLYDGNRLAILEYKGAPMPLTQKFSDSSRTFFDSLERTLLPSKGSKMQMWKHIQGTLDPSASALIFKQTGIEIDKVSKIFPVLICYDRTIHVPFVPDYLQARFEKRRKEAWSQKVAPLVVMHISDLEELRRYEGSKSFLDIIEEKAGEFSKNRIPTRANTMKDKVREIVLVGKKPKNHPVLHDRWTNIIDNAQKYFFDKISL